MMRYLNLYAVFLSCVLCASAHAEKPPAVDVALVLAVDVSYSMNQNEAEIQRLGYIHALRNPDVIEAIQSGVTGQIALAYLEWAGPTDQRLLVNWRVVSDAASARAFSDELEGAPYKNGTTTSISAGIDYAVKMFTAIPVNPLRRVIDISGDGYSDYGRPVTAARDNAIKSGITINGLPVMNKRATWREQAPPDLDKYYAQNVAGGRGSFTLVVRTLEEFDKTVLRKLVLEIASRDNADRGFASRAPDAATR